MLERGRECVCARVQCQTALLSRDVTETCRIGARTDRVVGTLLTPFSPPGGAGWGGKRTWGCLETKGVLGLVSYLPGLARRGTGDSKVLRAGDCCSTPIFPDSRRMEPSCGGGFGRSISAELSVLCGRELRQRMVPSQAAEKDLDRCAMTGDRPFKSMSEVFQGECEGVAGCPHFAVLERREVVGVDVVRRAAVEGLPLRVLTEHVVQRVARHLSAVEPCGRRTMSSNG